MNENLNEIYNRLLEKEHQYIELLKIAEKYNLLSHIEKYKMLLDVLNYIKSGIKIPTDDRNL